MRNPVTKVSMAAVVLLAVLIGISQFGGSTGNVAWGEVADQVEASQGFIWRGRDGGADAVSGACTVSYMSPTCGFRMDRFEAGRLVWQVYANRAAQAKTTVDHRSRTYHREPVPEAEWARLEEAGPDSLIREFLSHEYRSLGQKVIDGVPAEGIESTDPALEPDRAVDRLLARLWVSVDTGYPVRMEWEIAVRGGAQERKVYDQWQWDVALNADTFVADIPTDYTPRP